MLILIIEIGILFLLIFLNGFFALSEAAIISSNKSRLKILARQGNKNAQTVLELTESPEEFLSAIQIWITLIGIVSGIFGGVTLKDELVKVFNLIPLLAQYSETISYILLTISITYFAVVFGEIVPKRFALNNPEKLALRTAKILKLMIKIFNPFVYILKATTGFALRIAGMQKNEENTFSEEEVKLMFEEGVEKGIFEEEEAEIVENVLKLTDSKINEIMTHRLNFDYLEMDMTKEEIFEKIKKSKHSKYPVIGSSVDEIIGIAYLKNIFSYYAETGNIDLSKIVIKPNFIKETIPVYEVLEVFRKTGVHFGMVVNEHGLVEGLVTNSDIMDSVVGDMREENTPKILKRDDNSYLIDGLFSMDDVKEELNLDGLPYDDERFHTLGGFIINHLGIVPAEGDKFEWKGWNFEIIDMDGNRIDKVLLSRNQ